jgi:hypothetical protein
MEWMTFYEKMKIWLFSQPALSPSVKGKNKDEMPGGTMKTMK